MMAMRRCSPPIIALLTDFGLSDPFVGIMKAVILGRCAEARLVDLSHDIRPQAISEGAFWLAHCVVWLPAGATCVAVVDPGVGSARRGLVVASGDRVFVGPDNGLLGAPATAPGAESYAIDVHALGLAPSATFHGRDVFAPVAAEIAAGRLTPSQVGPRVHDPAGSPVPAPAFEDTRISGTVVVTDRFGNLISNIPAQAAQALGDVQIRIAGRAVPWVRTYSDVEPGALGALENAFGVLEVACRNGSAARTLAVGSGAPVEAVGRGPTRGAPDA
jgi:S-adenosyl-L-methionine hydrolase (adenosine-forming)